MLRTEDQPTTADYAYADAQSASKAAKEALRRLERIEQILLAGAVGDSPELQALAAETEKREQDALLAKNRKLASHDDFLKEAYSVDKIVHVMKELANG